MSGSIGTTSLSESWSLGVEAFRRVPPEGRGIAVGAFAGFQDVAIGLTGPLLGSVAAASAPGTAFLVGGLAAVLGTLVASGLRRHRDS
jgi:hypothetical protein